MKIKRIITGSLEENCYVLIDNNNCLVVDPGDNFELIKEEISNYNLIGILITHYHFDHIGALDNLLEYKNVEIYDFNLEEKEYNINNFSFKIIKTPGHTSDSVTFYFENEKTMFTGDFVFKCSIGRTDLPTGNMLEMKKSLDKIKKYDKDIKIYPGHGDFTSLNFEIKNNYYF